MQYDVFISHASVDKEAIAKPLAEALQARGLSVWLDMEQLQVGDSIRRGIDQGLAHSRFGVVILSPAYLESEWTRKELDALFTKEKHHNKTILPIAHQLSQEDIEAFSPMLSDKVSLSAREGIGVLADRIQASIQGTVAIATQHTTGKAPQSKRLVWRCTDESIENGQVSVLSVAETFCALGLYYWLAQHFQHHWWLLLTALAAPIILLRSEQSVALGLKWLRSYMDRDERDISRMEYILIVVMCSIVSVPLVYGLSIDFQGWALFWRASIVGAVALAVAYASNFAIRDVNTTLGVITQAVSNVWRFAAVAASTVSFAVVSAFAGIFAGAVAFAGAFAGVLAGTIILAVAFDRAFQMHHDAFFVNVLFMPFMGFGIWVRSLLIRVTATLRYPFPGLNNLPLNWQRITWGIDFTHLPELLPRATEIGEEFSVKGLLDYFSDSDLRNKTLILWLPFWYLPALIWRWSLKATLWLWWPLALVLKQPFNTDNLYQIRLTVVTIVSGWWKWLLLPAVVLVPWLLSGYYPEIGTLVNVLLSDQPNKLFAKLLNYAVPDPHSLRYAAIWLVCILSGVVWWKASNLKNQFKMTLEDETYITQIENDPQYWQQKQDFYQQAKSIARWHTGRIVAIILLGYSYILYLFQAWYPDQASPFLADWLIPYL